MQTEIQAKLRKIKQASTILRRCCTALLSLIALAAIGLVILLSFRVGGIDYAGITFRASDLTLGQRLLLIGMSVLRFGALFNCFYHLRQLFGNFSHEEIFTRGSVGALRRFGFGYLLWGIASMVWDGVWFGIFANPPRPFTSHFDAFGIGAILIAIAWFMDMAVELREENELTI